MITLQVDGETQRVVRYTDDSEINEARAIAFGLMPDGAKSVHIPAPDIQCTSHGPRRRYCPQCENWGAFAWKLRE